MKSFVIPEGPGQDNVASPWDLNITDNGGCDDGAYICMEQSLTDSAGALFNPYVDTNTHHWMLMAGGGISGATGIATCWPILRFGGASYTTVTAYAPAGTGYDFVNLPVADGPKSFSVVVGRQGALGGPSGNFVGVGPDTAGRFSAVAYSAPGSTAYSWVRVAQITRPLANGSLTLMSTTPVKTTSSEPVPLGNNNGECGFRVIGGQNESITWNGSSAFLGPMAPGQGANAYCAH